jgi:hypothetical protein
MDQPPIRFANVFVLRVNDYRPDLCRYTIPTIRLWAEKIGAAYVEITKRVFPEWPVTYEKMQVHRLGAGAAWNVLVDADFMLHPDLPNFLDIVPPEYVGMHYGFPASSLFSKDVYFRRVDHDQGIAGGFVLTSALTHDLWTPFEFGVEEALKRTRRAFIVDELCLSRNLARYGLRYTGIESGPEIARMMVHIGNEEKTPEQKKADVNHARNLYLDWFGREP